MHSILLCELDIYSDLKHRELSFIIHIHIITIYFPNTYLCIQK